MYLALVALGLCVTYAVLFFFFPLFFREPLRRLSLRSLSSIAVATLFYAIIVKLSYDISDVEIGNRILHAFGGGFVAFFVCFRAAADSRVSSSRFQFFTLSFLIVSALGIVNEIAEYTLQNFAGFFFATTANDTWLDLISNSVGALIAALCFVPFFVPDTRPSPDLQKQASL